MTSTPQEGRLREYLSREYPRLVAGLTLACGSRALAEDSVQEALVRAWIREGKGEVIESLGAWVTVVAVNLARSQLRRFAAEFRARDRLSRKAEADRSRSEDLSAEGRLDLIRAISRLPRRQRELIVLRYFVDLDTSDIARALEVKEGAVRAGLFRARQALARDLRMDEEDDEGSGHEPSG